MRLMIRIMCFVLLVLSTSYVALAQSSEDRTSNGWNYEGCGCVGSVDLRIFDGLSSAGLPGPFGGNEVHLVNGEGRDEDQDGAFTIANLNDTDGDTKPDFEDDYVIASESGVDEVDLMKLIIEPSGQFTPYCDAWLQIEGDVRVWKDYRKIEPMDNAIYRIATSSGSPISHVVYLEAISPSASFKDIKVSVHVDGVLHDEVRATALWVKEPSVVFKTRGNSGDGTPVPDGLPHNPVPYIDLEFGSALAIGTLINGRRAADNSRYGFGVFPPSSGEEDCSFGGRILLAYEVLPSDINLETYDVFFDIGRRKAPSVVKSKVRTKNLEILSESPPDLVDQSNDDFTPGQSNDTDEDRTWEGDSPNLFSYDAPSSPSIMCQPTSAFIDNYTGFKEYVRLSIGNDAFGGGVDTDELLGSRCSEFDSWYIHYNIVQQHDAASGFDPYDIENHTFRVNDAELQHSQPARWSGGGLGEIDIEMMSDATSNAYTIRFINDKWLLYEDYNTQPPTLLTSSQTSQNGPWTLQTSEIIITILQAVDPDDRWQNETLLDFNVYRAINPFSNTLDIE